MILYKWYNHISTLRNQQPSFDLPGETLGIYIVRLKWLSRLETIFLYNSALALVVRS